MADAIYNTEDVIDSRDVIARIDELRDEIETRNDEIMELEEELNLLEHDDQEDRDNLSSQIDDLHDEIEEIKEELDPLVALADEAEGYSADWKYGEALIRDDYFTEYAQQLAEDIGAIQSDMDWPASHIDWDAAADALKMDYSAVDFDGETYWIR